MNRTALITGASKRLGRAMAEHLAASGWHVIIHYNTSGGAARELRDALIRKYPRQHFSIVQTNLAEEQEVEKLIPRLIRDTSPIRLLINNASVFESGYLTETPIKQFENHQKINFTAPFLLTRDYALHCKTGLIINIVDTRITTDKSNYTAYTLSKKGLWNLTRMAALELAPGIRVNAIAPGVTLPPEDKDKAYLQKLAAKIPMKRPAGVEPVLESIDFIIENESLTGQLLFADGGENLGQND